MTYPFTILSPEDQQGVSDMIANIRDNVRVKHKRNGVYARFDESYAQELLEKLLRWRIRNKHIQVYREE